MLSNVNISGCYTVLGSICVTVLALTPLYIQHSQATVDVSEYAHSSSPPIMPLTVQSKLVDLGHMNPNRRASIAETFVKLNMSEGSYKDKGFLYTLEEEKAERIPNIFFQIAGILIILVLVFIARLLYSNKQLKLEITQKTLHLTKANAELLGYIKQLKEKEKELTSLNTNLERHVVDRTKAINKVNRDLTAEIEQRQGREPSLLLLSNAIESSRSIVLIIDKRHIIRYVSTAFLKLTGLSRMETHHQPIQTLQNTLTLPEVPNADFSLNAHGVVESELECIGANGQVHWLSSSISLLWAENREISNYVITFEDITLHKAHQAKMEQIALYDPLTGLENRVLFQSQLEKVISNVQRKATRTALLFIDIDDFKLINDNFGHETGDFVLKAVAHRLTAHVRKNDSVYRVSGDEFIILLNELQVYDHASKVTQQIINSFKKPIVENEREIFVTVSVGISVTPDDSINSSDLVHNADLAMYRAKQNGRNNFQFFCDDMNLEVKQKKLIETELQTAIQEETFYLVYLPIFDMKNGSIVGAEALIRWSFLEETRGPDDFISVAEETGSIIPIGQWVMQQAFNDIQQLLSAHVRNIKISFNISSRQLKDKYFISNIRKLFSSHPNYTQYFEFEITEDCFLNNQTDNINCLNDLQKMGFSIVLDDFGTGCASLSYLQRVPVNKIKIDRPLINALPDNEEHMQLTRATISMAHELGIQVTAEGVETEGHAKLLSSIGCDMAQGYYYEHPIRFEQLMARLSGDKLLP